jgi:hypothetical protein
MSITLATPPPERTVGSYPLNITLPIPNTEGGSLQGFEFRGEERRLQRVLNEISLPPEVTNRIVEVAGFGRVSFTDRSVPIRYHTQYVDAIGESVISSATINCASSQEQEDARLYLLRQGFQVA